MLFKFTTFINFSCFSSLGKIIQKKLQYFPRATYETTPECYQAQKPLPQTQFCQNQALERRLSLCNFLVVLRFPKT